MLLVYLFDSSVLLSPFKEKTTKTKKMFEVWGDISYA